MDNVDRTSDKKIDDKENWLNEHGQPSFEFLESLKNDGSLDALEKLKSIAFDLDVDYGPNTSKEDLIEKIRSATRNNPNVTT